MFDLLPSRADPWPSEFEPVGYGFDRESFDSWWARHRPRFKHLHPQILEQWVHRHWHLSEYSFIDLDTLTWRFERWGTDRILRDVHMRDEIMDADSDYRVIGRLEQPPATVMNATGTWDYPVLVLSTPNGILDVGRPKPDVRYLLIEGHMRMRYLNAMRVHSKPADEHEVFILESARPLLSE